MRTFNRNISAFIVIGRSDFSYFDRCYVYNVRRDDPVTGHQDFVAIPGSRYTNNATYYGEDGQLRNGLSGNYDISLPLTGKVTLPSSPPVIDDVSYGANFSTFYAYQVNDYTQTVILKFDVAGGFKFLPPP